MVVLVVEDSATMRELICHALRRIDAVVLIEAGDGADALAKLAEIRPDVIVTDLNMPVMDGFTLIEQIRARLEIRDVPVVVITTEGALEDQQRARSLGVATYVTKPIRQNAVVEAVLGAAGKVA
jgi:two-component system chemotaxis response regulator CheY